MADLVLGVVCVDEVLHYAAAFEDVDFFSIGVSVCQCGNSAVGVYRGEPGRFLLVGGHVYLVDFVGETELGESNADFYAVGCLGGVEG